MRYCHRNIKCKLLREGNLMVKNPFRFQWKVMVNPTNFKDQVFFHKLLALLKWLKVQRVFRERITPILKLRYVWVPIYSNVKNYCAQFYRPKLDNRIKGDHILKIAYILVEYHMLCWVFYIDLYKRVNWNTLVGVT